MIEGADTALTFEPHPLEVLRPEAAPKLIMPFSVKRDVIEGLGVEELVVIHFDERFSQLTAEEFIEHALVERLGARRVAVGENFHFGAKAQGDPAMLAARPEFETRVQPLVEVDGETVSSLADPGRDRGRRDGRRAPLPRRPLHDRGGGRRRGPARSRARLPDRQHRPRRPSRRPPGTASTPPSPTAPGRGQRRRPPDLRFRPRHPDRDLPARLRRRSLRPDPAGRLRPAPARRARLRRASTRWWRRCSATSRTPVASAPISPRPPRAAADAAVLPCCEPRPERAALFTR